MFAGVCLLLALFVYVRNGIQQWLTRVVFLRSNVHVPLNQIQTPFRAEEDESAYLFPAPEVIAKFVRATRFELVGNRGPRSPRRSPNWARRRQVRRGIFPSEHG